MDAVNKSSKQRGRPFPPGISGNVRGRPKGARNRRTRAVLEAAEAGGDMPLDFLLRLMRDPSAPITRRLEAAKAAAPFLHPKLNSVDPKPTEAAPVTSLTVRFVHPKANADIEDFDD
jgi:hypothetical protein